MDRVHKWREGGLGGIRRHMVIPQLGTRVWHVSATVGVEGEECPGLLGFYAVVVPGPPGY